MSKNPFDNQEIKALVNDSSVDSKPVDVNNHIHTPYSFSAFKNISQAVDMAVEESVKVLGINDFFVTQGYEEFDQTCTSKRIYPIFNVEFIGLHKEFQSQGLRINDPNNPGRIYLSGKGLKKEYILSDTNQKKFDLLIESSQNQVKEMIAKLNSWLNKLSSPFNLTYEGVKSNYAKELVRERHIASSLRNAIESTIETIEEQAHFYELLFETPAKSDISKPSAIEEEIRGKLLKVGGKAFVIEDEKAFLSPNEIKSIITDAGGMITYPLLLDDKNGNYTDFEDGKEELYNKLIELGIYNIELIPGRNSLEALSDYSKYFFNKGFTVSYGTEHNSPELIPLKVSCRNGVELSDELIDLNYKSTCVIAAHQYLVALGYTGYLNAMGEPYKDYIAEYIKLGNTLIKKSIT